MRGMEFRGRRRRLVVAVFALLGAAAFGLFLPSHPAEAQEPKVVKATPLVPGEAPGDRPYEMVRSGRRPPYAPLVDFDSLAGWTALCEGGAVAELAGSQKQRVWESPVAKACLPGKVRKKLNHSPAASTGTDSRSLIRRRGLDLRQQLGLDARPDHSPRQHRSVVQGPKR